MALPSPIPVNNFWSFMVYSGQHRSMLETDQKPAGLDSNMSAVKTNKDGSYTIWLSPEAPKGKEGNWIKIPLGKVLLRLCDNTARWNLGLIKLGSQVILSWLNKCSYIK